MLNTLPKKSLATSQKIGLGVLSFFVVGAIGLGVMSTINSIKAPFVKKATDVVDTTYLTDALNSAQDDKEAQKKLDTDADGLSDYDELNLYHTSPYLKDTDGDSYSDKEEIGNGYDPNCVGQTCSTGITKTDSAQATLGLPDTTATVQGSANVDASIEQLRKSTPEQIRKQLAEKGVPEDKLKAISDEKLVELYQKSLDTALKQTSKPVIDATSEPVKAPAQNPYDPATMSAADIRKLLLSTGKITEEQLSQFDDKTVRDMFLKTVEQIKKESPELTK